MEQAAKRIMVGFGVAESLQDLGDPPIPLDHARGKAKASLFHPVWLRSAVIAPMYRVNAGQSLDVVVIMYPSTV